MLKDFAVGPWERDLTYSALESNPGGASAPPQRFVASMTVFPLKTPYPVERFSHRPARNREQDNVGLGDVSTFATEHRYLVPGLLPELSKASSNLAATNRHYFHSAPLCSVCRSLHCVASSMRIDAENAAVGLRKLFSTERRRVRCAARPLPLVGSPSTGMHNGRCEQRSSEFEAVLRRISGARSSSGGHANSE